MYACPVCDYLGLTVKPYRTWPPPAAIEISPPYVEFLGTPSYEVCPQCKFEFGFDDDPGTSAPTSFEEYRLHWILKGRPGLIERKALE